MQTVLLTVPQQAHDNKDQQNEHHDAQNAAHDQIEQAAGLAGCFWRVHARRSDGPLTGHAWRLTGWRERKGKENESERMKHQKAIHENVQQPLRL